MIGFHWQRPNPNWPDAARLLPAGTPVLAIDNVQQLAEAKAINPGLFTILRHHYTGQHFPDDNLLAAEERARVFFRAFVDDTFRQYARHVDAVTDWNEYCDNSHVTPSQMAHMVAQGSIPTDWNEVEYRKRLNWVQAVNRVWSRKYRTQPDYAHIRLVSVNAPPGNFIPFEFARIVAEHGGILGHHPYAAINRDGSGAIRHDDRKWFSGRWMLDDQYFRSRATHVQWLGTESGPISADAGGGMFPLDGWRHPLVLAANPQKYLDVLSHRLALIVAWNLAHGGRYLGEVLFNSSGGDLWPQFDIRQPEMTLFATHIRDRVGDWSGPPPPPPPPGPPPTGQTAVLTRPFNVRTAPVIHAATRLLTARPGQRFEVVGPVAGDTFEESDEWLALKVYVHKAGLRLE